MADAIAAIAPGPYDSVLPDARVLACQKRRLVDYEILELAALFRAGATTSVEVTNAYLDRIKAFNGPFETYAFLDDGLYHAFVRIDEEAALAAARAADVRIAAERRCGTRAPLLCGIPMGFKDSIGVEGFAHQNGTTAFAGNVCLHDGPAVARVRAQGVVVLGITICSPFSGTVAGNFAGCAWNADYGPGGSSEGSGTATAGRLAAACFGEETAGSITFPSAVNGASGIKPSLGLVPVAGVMPAIPGFDVIGPIARSGADAALVLNAMLGSDYAADPQSVSAPIPFPALPITPRRKHRPLRGVTIGVSKTDWIRTRNPDGTTVFHAGVDPQSLYGPAQLAAFERVRAQLEALGATVKDFEGLDLEQIGEDSNTFLMPSTPGVTQPVLGTADGSDLTPVLSVIAANASDIRDVEAVAEFAETIPAEQRDLLLPVYARMGPNETTASFESAMRFNGEVPAAARREGERRRRKFMANYEASLTSAGVDFMLTMTLPQGNNKKTAAGASFPAQRNYVSAPNAMSWPMVIFPVGFDSIGLPISVQFWGPRFCEPQLVQAMIDYQAAYPEYHKAIPPDPVAKPGRALAEAGVEPASVPPEYSTDPAILDKARYR